MKRIPTFAIACCGVAAMAAGCASGPRTPDEFRVVRKAPLTIPPEYNLRPPAPGESRPQELESDIQARTVLFGQDIGKDATEGEKFLIKMAGGDAVDRAVRQSVDFDSTQTFHKTTSFADLILNFGKSKTVTDGPIDPAAESARLKADEAARQETIGNGQVVIRRRATGKLPGL